MPELSKDYAKLKRSLSLPVAVFYGLGTMVGGGIYALTGKVAGEAGLYAPFAFVISALLALLTAFSFAELVARYPSSAGAVRYTHEAWGVRWFSRLIGGLVILTGLVSAAALCVATAGFLQDLLPVSAILGVVFTVLILGGLAWWGINESAWVISAITLIEIGGLVFVLFVASEPALQTLSAHGFALLVPPSEAGVWFGIIAGAFLAFYAFIGFEDMVHIAEEVKNVRHNLPLAIIICIFAVLVLYVLISLVAVLAVSPETLAASKTPMAEIVIQAGFEAGVWLVLISLLAGVNGALVQIIMVSRVLYGMARSGKVPAFLGYVSARTQTPVYATVLAVFTILVLALIFDLTILARATSAIVLFIFTVINLALWVVKRRADQKVQSDIISVPIWLPLSGALCCALMLFYQLVTVFFR